MGKPDGERIVALETQMTDLTKKVDDGFKENTRLMEALTSEVRQLSLTLLKKLNVETDHEKRLVKLEQSGNLWKWLSPSLAAILGSVMTFLVIEFLRGRSQ